MSAYTYSQIVTALGTLLEVPITSASSPTPSSDPNFNNILQSIINDAELRIYRELDFIAAKLSDATVSTTVSTRKMTIPSEIIVVQSIALITPSGSTPSTGKRVQFLRTSLDTINMIWPTESLTQTPSSMLAYYAMLDPFTAILAPTPDNTYVAEVVGIQRPTPLSSSNPTTYLTTTYADLFLSACMVFGSGYQQNFGATSSDPQMSQSWESRYQSAKASAVAEEARRRGVQPEV